MRDIVHCENVDIIEVDVSGGELIPLAEGIALSYTPLPISYYEEFKLVSHKPSSVIVLTNLWRMNLETHPILKEAYISTLGDNLTQNLREEDLEESKLESLKSDIPVILTNLVKLYILPSLVEEVKITTSYESRHYDTIKRVSYRYFEHASKLRSEVYDKLYNEEENFMSAPDRSKMRHTEHLVDFFADVSVELKSTSRKVDLVKDDTSQILSILRAKYPEIAENRGKKIKT